MTAINNKNQFPPQFWYGWTVTTDIHISMLHNRCFYDKNIRGHCGSWDCTVTSQQTNFYNIMSHTMWGEVAGGSRGITIHHQNLRDAVSLNPNGLGVVSSPPQHLGWASPASLWACCGTWSSERPLGPTITSPVYGGPEAGQWAGTVWHWLGGLSRQHRVNRDYQERESGCDKEQGDAEPKRKTPNPTSVV